MTPTHPSQTLYFAYGSNLSLAQMNLRCPTSSYIGLARLRGYRWIINTRGYANIVEVPTSIPTSSSSSVVVSEPASLASQSSLPVKSSSPLEAETHSFSNEVWGLVYALRPQDEKNLDVNEGVPVAYTKAYLGVEFWASASTPTPTATPSLPSISTSTSSSASISLPTPIPTSLTPISSTPVKTKMLVYIDLHRTSPAQPREEYIERMNRGIRDAEMLGVPRGYVEGVLRGFIPAPAPAAAAPMSDE